MNKTEFILELCKKTGLSEAESTQVNQIFEDNMFIGKKHTEKIISEISDKLGTDNEHEQDVIVIRMIIALARELGFVCLAEGAERKEQVDRLRSLGCDVIQGYYYSKPVPLDEFEERFL